MRLKALLVAAVAAVSAGPVMAAGYGEFTGDWRNEDSSTHSITRVRVMPSGGGLKVRVWGQCNPSDCDWGVENAVAFSSTPGGHLPSSATDLMITFHPGNAETILILRERPGDSLTYSIYTRFTDGSGRRPFVSRGSLRKHHGGWGGWGGGGGGWPPGGGGGGGGWPPGGGGGGGGGGGDDGPDTHSNGIVTVPQSYSADLDEGLVTSNATADFQFQAITAWQKYLTPRNGARFWVGDGSNRGYDGCSSGGGYSPSPVPLASVPPGTYVCVRTNAGRYSQFRVNGITPGSPATLTIGYTTWE